jgi:isoamylase
MTGATRLWPGTPSPLGATRDGAGVNFAVYGEHATGVELCLFDRPDAATAVERPRRVVTLRPTGGRL